MGEYKLYINYSFRGVEFGVFFGKGRLEIRFFFFFIRYAYSDNATGFGIEKRVW